MIDYEEEWLWSTLLQWKGSVLPGAMWVAIPASIFAAGLVLCEDHFPDIVMPVGFEYVANGQTYSACTATILFALSFRSSQALGRFWEGTSLLHQMRGEWYDSVSCCMTFSRASVPDKPEQVRVFRHTLVRLMSLCHGSALEEIKESESEEFEVLDMRGLDYETLAYLEECKSLHDFNRVEVLLHMIQVLITTNLDNGVIKIAPPILSRVYQTLSRGLVNLLNATKIKNTKFPFPYSQLISFFVLLHVFWTPMLMSSIVKSPWMCAIVTFLPIFGMVALNRIAIELEMPFGNDQNDLPLDHFQQEMNRGLMMLLHSKADHVATTGPHCLFNFESLERQQELMMPCDSEGMKVAMSTAAVVKYQSSPAVMKKQSSALKARRSSRHRISKQKSMGGEFSMFRAVLGDVRDIRSSIDTTHTGPPFYGSSSSLSKEGQGTMPQVSLPIQTCVPKAHSGTRGGADYDVSALANLAPVGEEVDLPRLATLPPMIFPRPREQQPDLPSEQAAFDTLLRLWVEKVDDQVDALARNTESIAALTERFPYGDGVKDGALEELPGGCDFAPYCCEGAGGVQPLPEFADTRASPLQVDRAASPASQPGRGVEAASHDSRTTGGGPSRRHSVQPAVMRHACV